MEQIYRIGIDHGYGNIKPTHRALRLLRQITPARSCENLKKMINPDKRKNEQKKQKKEHRNTDF